MSELPETAGVRAELARVDGKCSILAGLAGAASAFAATQVSGPAPVAVRSLLCAAGLVMVVATVVLLQSVLRPRLGSTGFCLYATMSAEEIRSQTGGHDEAEDLRWLSALAVRKFRCLSAAIDLITVGMVLLGAGLAVGALT